MLATSLGTKEQVFVNLRTNLNHPQKVACLMQLKVSVLFYVLRSKRNKTWEFKIVEWDGDS